MESKLFNINDWLPAQSIVTIENPKQENYETFNVEQDIEKVTASLERAQVDLTADYNNWLQIGFGLANELGEQGRSYFHRISRFNPKYTLADTDKKYDSCLKTQPRELGGTTIKTFFYLAKQAKIDINGPARHTDLSAAGGEAGGHKKNTNPAESSDPETDNSDPLLTEDPGYSGFKTPLLEPVVYENLPKILHDSSSLFVEGIERDIFLLSAITVLSACLPNIEGIYFNRRLSAHLYLFVTGPSASGKGIMVWARDFAREIHEKMYSESCLAQSEYLKELAAFEGLNKNQKTGSMKPEEPPRKMLFIPANSSSAALTQLLAENNFRGLIFESEADTLSNTAKQDWGDSSDIFRKAFHHENTSMARRLKKEFIEIKDPHLAICLSGTPKQVHNLMPEVENGLFSRFMYYAFQDSRGFLNPFVSYRKINYDDFFTQRSYEVFHLYEKLSNLKHPVTFSLTGKQALTFTSVFQTLLEKNKMLLTRDLDANTKRLGVITFRIAMVLSALRMMDLPIGQKTGSQLICSDTDFKTAMSIATTLESHAVAVYQQMPKVTLKGLRLSFYEKLPKVFNRQDYLNIAKQLGIAAKTAEKYIAYFKTKLLDHTHNEYTKIKEHAIEVG